MIIAKIEGFAKCSLEITQGLIVKGIVQVTEFE